MPKMPNERDCGWIYSCPMKHVQRAPVEVPRPSQIDCLNAIEPPAIEENKLMVQETDSKYIQLAKMGGRHDLLRFKENQVNTGPAKHYPRSSWYYLEDNLLEDKMAASKLEQPRYEFGQPEYMMHESYNPTHTSPKPDLKPNTRDENEAACAVTNGQTASDPQKSLDDSLEKPISKVTFPKTETTYVICKNSRKNSNISNTSTQKATQKSGKEDENNTKPALTQEPFKLSKFKNVASKVDSHRKLSDTSDATNTA